jgi:hypothetical protein
MKGVVWVAEESDSGFVSFNSINLSETVLPLNYRPVRLGGLITPIHPQNIPKISPSSVFEYALSHLSYGRVLRTSFKSTV